MLRDRLRDDRGATDPVLSIIAILGTMLISATMFATLIMTFDFIGKYSTEQTESAILTTAGKAWALDANNASQITMMNDQTVIFYELPGRSPGVYQERGDGYRDNCRKSTWKLDDGTLTNVVSFFENEHCDLGTDPGTASATTTLVTVNGFDADTLVVAENSAGRDLHYEDGFEVGLTSADPALQSQNTRDPYWRDYEWDWTQPKTVDVASLNGPARITMPISGKRDAALNGRTWIIPTPQGETLTNPEEQPEDTRYNPAPIDNLNIERSATHGDIYGSLREGIQVTWDAVSCGPFSTEYTVEWNTSTLGALNRTVNFNAHGAFDPVQIENIPNGSTGVVTVTAACPASVSDHTSDLSEGFTQSIPAPILTGQANAANPHVHALDWSRVSSLQTRYSVEYRINGGAFTEQDITLPNPTTDQDVSLGWDVGSTYGQEHRYRIIASVGATTSNPSNVLLIATPWPAISPPTLTGTPAVDRFNTVLSNVSCPVGTNGEYRQRHRLNNGAWASWTTWGLAGTASFLVPEGARIDVQAQARCAYSATQVSPPTDSPDDVNWIRPITSIPESPGINYTDVSDAADPIGVTFTTNGCPAGTTKEYRYRVRVNAGSWGAWTAWAADSTVYEALNRGSRIQTEATARCVSDFATGPESPSNTNTWDRPIPAPAPVTNVGTDGGGSSEPKNDRVIYDAAICPAGTTAQYRHSADLGITWDAWTPTRFENVNTAWGKRYTYQVQARCVSTYVNSDPSATASTTWVTKLPKPTAPGLTVPVRVTMDVPFDVTLSPALCPAGTTVRYVLRGTNTVTPAQWWSGSGFNFFETDSRGDPTRWTGLTVEHMGPKAKLTDYVMGYEAIAVCDGPDVDGDPDDITEAASSTANTNVVYPALTAAPDNPVINFTMDEASGTANAQHRSLNCPASTWPEYRTRSVVQDDAGNIRTLGAWTGWSTTANAGNSTPSATPWQSLMLNVPQGHRADVRVEARCVDLYTSDAWGTKGPISGESNGQQVQTVAQPTGIIIINPVPAGAANNSTHTVTWDGACVPSASVRYQTRTNGNDPGSAWNDQTASLERTTKSQVTTARWAYTYGFGARGICKGQFADSTYTDWTNTPNTQAALPPTPTGVSLSVPGGNTFSNKGAVYAPTTVYHSGSWTGTVSGSCPAGTSVYASWQSGGPTIGANVSLYRGSGVGYATNYAYAYFQARVYCQAAGNGILSPSYSNTVTETRSAGVGATFYNVPVPGAPGSGGTAFNATVINLTHTRGYSAFTSWATYAQWEFRHYLPPSVGFMSGTITTYDGVAQTNNVANQYRGRMCNSSGCSGWTSWRNSTYSGG